MLSELENQSCRSPGSADSMRYYPISTTAIVLCRDNGMPLRVFDINRAGDLKRIVSGEDDVGTLVDNDTTRANG